MPVGFEETQRFNQCWLWLVLLGTTFVLVLIFAYGLIEQLVLGRPWGDRPVSDTVLVLSASAILIFQAGMLYIFYTLKLITCVTENGVRIRFYPFRSTLIPFADIQSCEARTYRPLAEYGGWGIKYGRSGKAYNISGDRGVQLVLTNGRRILIGSQRAEELATTIEKFRLPQRR